MGPSAGKSGDWGVQVIESCLSCVHRQDGLFCRLPVEALQELNAIRQDSLYPSGVILFLEGEPPRGLFILCSGHVRLSMTAKDGKRLVVRDVEPGEVLGLSSVVSGSVHPVTAEIVSPSRMSFIPRPKFLEFMEQHAPVSARVAEHLSMELHKAWQQALMLGTTTTAQARLAQLLLTWANESGKPTPQGTRVSVSSTQRQIGEMIGVTRETVSRMLGGFRRRGLIRVKGASVTLLQPEGLRSLTGL